MIIVVITTTAVTTVVTVVINVIGAQVLANRNIPCTCGR